MPFNRIKSHFAAAVDNKTETAEIKMYGNVVSKRPVDWWTGKPAEGYFIIGSEVLKKLEEISGCKKLNIRLNSLGGDVHEAILIHNRLREMAKNGTEIHCSVDGVAMSAGSMIMCAADKVTVTASSLIMIHKSLTGLCGWYNGDDLIKLAEESGQYDRVIAAAYRRKTGKTEKELLDMMSEETYMPGEEAVEKGFADELMENGEKLEIAACADKSALIVNGGYFPLMGLKCPESIPMAEESEPESGEGAAIENEKHKEVKTVGKDLKEIKDLKELKAENPELAAAVEEEIKSACLKEQETASGEAAKKAAEAERKRIAEIDEIAAIYSADTVKEAKYGDEACTAAEMAYRAAKEDAKRGEDYLRNMQRDNEASKAEKVTGAALPDDTQYAVRTEEQLMQDARDTVGAMLTGK